MTPSEAAVLLAAIARTDKRTVGEAEARSWAEVMTKHNIKLPDALGAVVEHFGTSHEYVMPIHIVEKVRAMNRDWWQRVGVPPIPGNLTWRQEKEWRTAWCAAIKAGEPDPSTTANKALGISPVEAPPNPNMVRALEALTQKSKAVK